MAFDAHLRQSVECQAWRGRIHDMHRAGRAHWIETVCDRISERVSPHCVGVDRPAHLDRARQIAGADVVGGRTRIDKSSMTFDGDAGGAVQRQRRRLRIHHVHRSHGACSVTVPISDRIGQCIGSDRIGVDCSRHIN